VLRALSNGEAGLSAMQEALDTISNNIANMDTDSYKTQSVDFADLVYQGGGPSGYPQATAGQDAQLGDGSRVAAISHDLTQGNLRQTNRPLDLAINGDGYFAVTGTAGKTMYTRDGRLSINANGQLTTSDGLLLAPRITVPSGDTNLVIAGNGQVTATDTSGQTVNLGAVRVNTFENPEGLQAMGGNLYQSTAASGTARSGTPGTGGTGQLVQGSLEQSNVSLVREMADMMVVERTYEFNSRAVQAADSMWSMANNLHTGS